MSYKKQIKRFKTAVFLILILPILLHPSILYSHGPKGHSQGAFTALEAVKQGVKLFDKLLAAGKVPEIWEIDLNKIEIMTRTAGDQKELVIRFRRRKGNPESVYIFFSGTGEYVGSNFTGK